MKMRIVSLCGRVAEQTPGRLTAGGVETMLPSLHASCCTGTSVQTAVAYMWAASSPPSTRVPGSGAAVGGQWHEWRFSHPSAAPPAPPPQRRPSAAPAPPQRHPTARAPGTPARAQHHRHPSATPAPPQHHPSREEGSVAPLEERYLCSAAGLVPGCALTEASDTEAMNCVTEAMNLTFAEMCPRSTRR